MAATRRTSQRVTLLMLVLASVTVLTLDYRGEVSHGIGHIRNGARDVLAPLQRGIAAALHPVGDLFAGAARYGSVQAQNQQLQTSIGELRRKMSEYAAEQQQLRQIAALDKVTFVSNIKMVDAEVLSAPTSNFRDTFELDRGTSSGVAVGEPVVGSNGLVGTVTSAGRSTATVQLITDTRSSVDIRLGANASGFGVVTGRGLGERLNLQLVSGSPNAKETVYTAGTVAAGAGAYPAGLPVGTVSSVHSSPGGFSKTATVTPLANLDSLQYVGVLLWLPSA
ncbi:MAG TPA: rod shape-determining protein MreC [Acidimicrobiales bacterium]|nr:rod shape-determining protein MreC [Acidimicrobiales bacterium]